jgi:hypothetical protein
MSLAYLMNLGPGKIGFRDDMRLRGTLPGGFPFHAGAYGLARGLSFGLFSLTWPWLSRTRTC